MATNDEWLDQVREEALEPDLPACDTHLGAVAEVPYYETVIEHFGPERWMFESNSSGWWCE